MQPSTFGRGGAAARTGSAKSKTVGSNAGGGGSPDVLLAWCKQRTASYGIQISNFTTSWSNGLAFCALVHSYSPHSFDFSQLSPDNAVQNLELAFTTAQRLGVPRLLEPEDVGNKPEKLSMMTYIATLAKLLRKNVGDGSSISDLIEQAEARRRSAAPPTSPQPATSQEPVPESPLTSVIKEITEQRTDSPAPETVEPAVVESSQPLPISEEIAVQQQEQQPPSQPESALQQQQPEPTVEVSQPQSPEPAAQPAPEQRETTHEDDQYSRLRSRPPPPAKSSSSRRASAQVSEEDMRMQTELHEKDARISQLLQQHEQLSAQIRDLQAKILSDSNAQQDRQTEQTQKLETRVRELTEENKSLQETIVKSQHENSNLFVLNYQLQNQLENVEASSQHSISELKRQLQIAEEQKTQLQTEKDRMLESKNTDETRSENLLVQLRATTEANNLLQQRVAELEKELSSLVSAMPSRDSLATAEEKIRSLTEQLQSSETELSKVRDENAQLLPQLQQLQQQLAAASEHQTRRVTFIDEENKPTPASSVENPAFTSVQDSIKQVRQRMQITEESDRRLLQRLNIMNEEYLNILKEIDVHTRDKIKAFSEDIAGAISGRSNSSAIVEINVGGVLFTTSASTISSLDDCVLKRMLTGPNLATDKEGRIFVDRDGVIFRHVLNFVRERHNFALSTEDPATLNEIKREAMFFGLSELASLVDAHMTRIRSSGFVPSSMKREPRFDDIKGTVAEQETPSVQQQEVDALYVKIESLEKALADVNSKLSMTKKLGQEVVRELQNTEQQLAESTKQIEQLQQELTASEREVALLTQKFEAEQQLNDELNSDLTRKDEEMCRLREDVARFALAAEQSSGEQQSSSTIAKLMMTVEENRNALSEKDATIAELTQHQQRLRESLEQTTKQLNALQGESHFSATEKMQLEEELTRTQEALELAKQDSVQLREYTNRLEEEKREAATQMESLNLKLHANQERTTKLEVDLQRMRELLSEVSTRRDEAFRIIDDIAHERDRFAERARAASMLENELEQTRIKVRQLEAERDSYTTKLAQYSTQISKMEEINLNLSKLNDQAVIDTETLEREKSVLEQRVRNAEDELRRVNNYTAELEQQCSQLRAEQQRLSNSNTEGAQLRSLLNDRQRQIEILQEDVRNLDFRLSEASTAREKALRKAEESAAAKSQLESALSSMSRQKEELESMLASTKKQLADVSSRSEMPSSPSLKPASAPSVRSSTPSAPASTPSSIDTTDVRSTVASEPTPDSKQQQQQQQQQPQPQPQQPQDSKPTAARKPGARSSTRAALDLLEKMENRGIEVPSEPSTSANDKPAVEETRQQKKPVGGVSLLGNATAASISNARSSLKSNEQSSPLMQPSKPPADSTPPPLAVSAPPPVPAKASARSSVVLTTDATPKQAVPPPQASSASSTPPATTTSGSYDRLRLSDQKLFDDVDPLLGVSKTTITPAATTASSSTADRPRASTPPKQAAPAPAAQTSTTAASNKLKDLFADLDDTSFFSPAAPRASTSSTSSTAAPATGSGAKKGFDLFDSKFMSIIDDAKKPASRKGLFDDD